jgi:pilus assembly protein CpaB
MSKRRVALLLVAGLIAVITVLIARTLMKPQEEVATAPVVQTTEVLAAARDLPIGTILKDSDMKWIQWASESDTTQFYVKSKDDTGKLVGAVLRDGMRAGEPFLTGHVVQPKDHGFLAVVLTPGKRAMSVTLSPNAEVAGFIFPGDHVDVILTHSFSRKDNADYTERRVSETVLTDVRVLALDQKSDSMSAEAKVAQLATLEVAPKQAEKLALAADLAGSGGAGHGSLSLVLRSLAAEDELAPALDAAGNALPVPKPNTTTWDSDVSPAFPGVNGDDGLMQRVHIMRGKDATDTNFERHK